MKTTLSLSDAVAEATGWSFLQITCTKMILVRPES